MNVNLRPRIMLTGKNGQIGWELQRTLAPLGVVVALDRQQLNLANHKQIKERVREIKPDLIVNAAAYTEVDKAEEEPELAMAINGVAPGILAEEAKRINAAVIHYSTDYVFDGTKTTPYVEQDEPSPLNVYGRTKLEGEWAIQSVGVPHLILRTSWVYGMRGKNFLLTILEQVRERDTFKVVNDQVGTPNWSRMIAEATSLILSRFLLSSSGCLLFNNKNGGLYHLSAVGSTSWYGFAKLIIKIALKDTNSKLQITPVATAEYPRLAHRPNYSLLASDKLKKVFGICMPEWEPLLKLALKTR